MILSEFHNGNRHANVCNQGGEWVTMLYVNDAYLKSIVSSNEDEAELVAEDWVNGKKDMI